MEATQVEVFPKICFALFHSFKALLSCLEKQEVLAKRVGQSNDLNSYFTKSRVVHNWFKISNFAANFFWFFSIVNKFVNNSSRQLSDHKNSDKKSTRKKLAD